MHRKHPILAEILEIFSRFLQEEVTTQLFSKTFRTERFFFHNITSSVPSLLCLSFQSAYIILNNIPPPLSSNEYHLYINKAPQKVLYRTFGVQFSLFIMRIEGLVVYRTSNNI